MRTGGNQKERLTIRAGVDGGESHRAISLLRRPVGVLAFVLLLAACDVVPEIRGRVIDVRGGCHNILGVDGVRYALRRGQYQTPLKAGDKVRVRGYLAPSTKQECVGAVVVEAQRVEVLP